MIKRLLIVLFIFSYIAGNSQQYLVRSISKDGSAQDTTYFRVGFPFELYKKDGQGAYYSIGNAPVVYFYPYERLVGSHPSLTWSTISDPPTIPSNTNQLTNGAGFLVAADNIATATLLQTSRNINGTAFNGSQDITIPAAAGTLTGATLNSGVTASSLTSVGTLANLTVTNPITGSVTGNAATATALQNARTINGVSFNGTANITVTAATLTTTRAIYGNNFDGSAALTQIIGSAFGGTANGFTKFSGPTTSEKTFTLPNASATILTDNAVVTPAQGGLGVASLTGIIVGNGASAATAVTGTANQVLRRNAGNTSYEFATFSGGGDLLAANNLSDLSNATTARSNLGLVIGTNVLAPNGSGASLTGIPITAVTGYTGYTLSVQALTSSPTDAQTIYFGNMPKAPTTTAATSKIYIRKAGTIKVAEIYCFSGTAGTNESWSIYVRVNNSSETLIATVSASTSERVFSNTGLSISVSVGDYIEIKSVNPTWVTNPLTTIFGGYIYIE